MLDVLEVGKQALGKQATFGLYDILAARDDLTRLYPTPDFAAQAAIKRLLIGAVRSPTLPSTQHIPVPHIRSASSQSITKYTN